MDQYAESMTPEVSFCVDGGWVVGGVEPHVSDSVCAIGRAGLLVILVFSSHLPFGGNLSFFLFLLLPFAIFQKSSSLLVSFHPSHNHTPQEIILHTLFESGSSKVQDLERYISDDVERYGARLSELEKKLVGAYRELVSFPFSSL